MGCLGMESGLKHLQKVLHMYPSSDLIRYVYLDGRIGYVDVHFRMEHIYAANDTFIELLILCGYGYSSLRIKVSSVVGL